MAYQPGVPTGSVPLNQDYANVMGNFGSLNSQWQVDHVPLTDTSGTPPNGYHTYVHLVPFSTPTTNPPPNYPIVTGVNGPAATAGYGQLFGVTVTDGLNTDSSLYYLSGGGLLTQLTRNLEPLSASVGYTFLPGGLLLQWGNNGSSNVDITFPKQFPNAVFNISVTPIGSLAVSPSPAIFSSSTVKFQSKNSAAQGYNFSWIAIGN
jgi:hypothetical protein